LEEGKLDQLAERYSKKSKKASVDKQLLNDFTRFRTILSRNIMKLNSTRNLNEEELDESVQRILDRLIFIRNCEDRELEPKNLISNYRQWTSRGKGKLVKSLREDFAYFDEQYNSKLFAEHLCDSLEIDNDVLEDVIVGLYYTKDKAISYDFSIIDADVLGTIYEQYLGHILKKTDKRAKITKSRLHRKEQGIYYTPTYVVDFIVKNTLGALLKNKKLNVEKIRILDPACGSGSFLIKAFDVLNEFYEKSEDYQQTQLDLKTGIPFTKKVQILQNNIFGVDLDKQAVEIAQLNLLLKIAEKGHRLPLLEQNIKCGNSLIDDENLAGNGAFDWKQQFQEIMKDGGFNAVIGNPPYVRHEELGEFKPYFESNYDSYKGTADLLVYFFEKGISLLQNRGYFGFIASNKFMRSDYGKNLRKYVLKHCSIEKIIDLVNCPYSKKHQLSHVFLFFVRENHLKDTKSCSAL
jgi:type I restriction-modification system DNA methylase subunit